jgi:hypothetical protein
MVGWWGWLGLTVTRWLNDMWEPQASMHVEEPTLRDALISRFPQNYDGDDSSQKSRLTEQREKRVAIKKM